MKICTKCGINKPLSEYNKSNKTCLISHRGDCKECQHSYNKEHYSKNKQQYLDNQKIRRYRSKKKQDNESKRKSVYYG